MKLKLPYIIQERDRHGNVRVYFRKKPGPRIRIREPIGSPEFLAAYKAAVEGRAYTAEPKRPAPIHRPGEGTLAWLIGQYYRSPEFRTLGPTTQRTRQRILDKLCKTTDDPAKPPYGERPYALIEARHIRRIRDAEADRPEAANGILKSLRPMFAWALDAQMPGLRFNPARDVPTIKTGSEGFHSWTIEEVEQYEARHPIGTQARLALALLLYTGQRRSDVVRFGEPMVRDGWLHFRQWKNRNRKPVDMELPILPALRDIIRATSPIGTQTWLVTSFGKPFTIAGFGNWFRDRCNEAGLPHCSAHGLRKAAATRLAELGCSDREIMAVTGHRSAAEVDRYTRAARQKILARAAMERVAGRPNGPHLVD